MKYLYLLWIGIFYFVSNVAIGANNNCTDCQIKPPLSAIPIIWYEVYYDSILNDSVSILKINYAYCDTIGETEKAVLGYFAKLHGCNGIIDSYQLAKNDLLSALKLDHQYAKTHIDLLMKWFSNDSQVLSSIQNKEWYPITATIQNQFEELSIWKSNDTIITSAKVITGNLRDFYYYRFEECMYFKVSEKGLILISTHRTTPVLTKLEF